MIAPLRPRITQQSVLPTAYERDEAKLAEWQFARRVQAKPGTTRGVSEDVAVEVQATKPEETLSLSLVA